MSSPAHSPEPQALAAICEDLSSTNNPHVILEQLSLPVIPISPPSLHIHLSLAAAADLDLKPMFIPVSKLVDSSSRQCTPQTLSTGCPSIDRLLHGGIPATNACIFEISGAAGVGKTQLALQTGVMACMPACNGGLDGSCIMVFTEGPPPVRRLAQIESSMCRRAGLQEGSILQKIIVECIATAEELQQWALWRLPYLLRKTGARVALIDSVTAVYRVDFEDAMLERAVHLGRVAAGLKLAVGRVGGVCVCLNQVAQRRDAEGGLGLTVPALGAGWTKCVEGRLYLERRGGQRFAKVLEACWVGRTRGWGEKFWVSDDGVVDN